MGGPPRAGACELSKTIPGGSKANKFGCVGLLGLVPSVARPCQWSGAVMKSVSWCLWRREARCLRPGVGRRSTDEFDNSLERNETFMASLATR